MLDRHEAHRDHDMGRGDMSRDAAGDRAKADRPLMDREVPLPRVEADDAPVMVALHQWLDGETDSSALDPRDAALWTRIAADTDRRRQVTAPASLMANIMAALPEAPLAVEAPLAASTAAAPSVVAPAPGLSLITMLLIGGGMVALGVLIAKMVG